VKQAIRRHRWELAAGAILAIVTVLWYRPYLFTEKVGFLDWPKELFYYSALRHSLRGHGLPPWGLPPVPQEIAFFPSISARHYAGSPETLFFSPFLPLALLSTPVFFKLYLGGSLAIALGGTLFLSSSLKWSPLTGGVLYCLLFLNPWLIQHLVIGYSPWVTVAWIPLALALLVRGHPFWAGAVLSLIVWAGGLLVFTWTMLGLLFVLLAYLARRRPRKALHVLYAIVAALVVAGPRLILIYVDNTKLTHRTPQKSYSSLSDIWGLLTNTSQNPYDFPKTYDIFGVNLYDGSLITGTYFWVLLAVLVGIAVWQGMDRWFVVACLAGMAAFTFLGWNGVWPWLANLLSPLDVEDYPWQLLPVGLVFAIVLLAASVEWLSRRNRFAGMIVVASVFPVLVTFYDRTHFFIHKAI
jgi:hypothetical protein